MPIIGLISLSSQAFAQDATAQDATAQDATAQDATAQDATAPDAALQDAALYRSSYAEMNHAQPRISTDTKGNVSVSSVSEPSKTIAQASNLVYLKTKQRIITDNGVIADAAVQACLKPFSNVHVREIAVLPNGFLYAVSLQNKERSSVDTERLCRELRLCSTVEYAERVQALKPHQTSFPTPNDPLFARQYHLQRIKTQEAWAVTAGDSTVVIAVCDTGVDWEHEDLAGNIWVNPGENGTDAQGRNKRTNGVDDDRNGKIDDWHGWDFVGAASEGDLLSGRFREDNDPKPRFPSGLVPQELPNHGTIVAGIVAAQMNNARGGTGAAPRCKILPIKCSTDGVRLDGIYRPYEAVLYAAQMGAKIIVCSFGGGRYSRAEEDIINAATAQGALVIAAAGNSARLTDNVEYPASYTTVLAVGSSNAADRAAASSDFGVKIDVFAPGERIFSTVTGNEYTDSFSGTSMAAPLVAAAAALLKSRFPAWSPEQIRQQLRATSDNVLLGAAAPLNRPLGFFGRLNMQQALTASQPGLVAQNISVQAATGVVQDAQPVVVRLTVKNHLATALNAAITLRSLDGRAAALDDAQNLGTTNIGTIAANAEHTVSLTIQLEPAALTGTGLRTADFVIVMLADGYINYQRLSIPYNLRSSQRAQMLVSPLVDFSQQTSTMPQNALQNVLQATVRNSGVTSLNISSMSISGTNSADFHVQAQSPISLNSASMLALPVQFSPQTGFAGMRTAMLTLTAVPQASPMLGAVAGGYEFSSTQAEYVEFSDGTPLQAAAGVLDDAQITFGMGFPFRYGGEQFESITLSSNGFCAFAPAESLVQQGAVTTRPLGTFVAAKGYIAVAAADMIFPVSGTGISGTGTTAQSGTVPSDMRFKTEGTAPNRIFTVQWRNAALKTAPDVRLNAQLRLYETSPRVEIHFGSCSIPATRGTISIETGLRGNSSADIHARRVSEDIRATWATSAEAASNEDVCELSANAPPERGLPQRGLLYRWSPLAAPRQITLQPITRTIALKGLVRAATGVRLEASSMLDLSNVTDAMITDAIEIAPNPVESEFTCALPKLSSEAVLSIVNQRGEIIAKQQIPRAETPQHIRFATQGWAQGIYVVRVVGVHQTLQQRFVVLR
ncbi:MAG: S8 family serine peptidase [Candidatus Kapabacteria bacterium]|nr:S8 family serine peptidase [Candidatus Kapabacteria bacterium]